MTTSKYFVDFLKSNKNIQEGINEQFINFLNESHNPHIIIVYGKPRMGKSTLLNQLLRGFDENNNQKDNEYFSLNRPFEVRAGEANFTTEGCNIFGKIKLSELLKKNCFNYFNNMDDADLFIVDTEGLNSLGGNTPACTSAILTLLQVSTIKLYFIGDIEKKDIEEAEQLIKLSDILNYKKPNKSTQKIFMVKKNSTIDRKIKDKDGILKALNNNRIQIQNLINNNLNNKNLSDQINYFCLPNFEKAEDNKEFERAYQESMKSITVEIANSVQNRKTNSSDLLKEIDFFKDFFGEIQNINQIYNLGEVFEEIFEQKAEEYIMEVKKYILNLINNMDMQIMQFSGSIENTYKGVNIWLNEYKKIEIEILMKVIPKKVEKIKNNLTYEINNIVNSKINDFIQKQENEITNSIQNENMNQLILYIKKCCYQEEITQEKIIYYYNDFLSLIKKKYQKFLLFNPNNNNLIFQKLKNDYFIHANLLKSKIQQWKDALYNFMDIISPEITKIIDEISSFNLNKLQQIKNNNYKNYYNELENLKKIYDFKIFNQNDYNKKINKIIYQIKKEIDKQINTIESIEQIDNLNEKIKKIEENKIKEEKKYEKMIQELNDNIYAIKLSYEDKITNSIKKIEKLQQDLDQINETNKQKQEELENKIIQQLEAQLILKNELIKEKEYIINNNNQAIRELEKKFYSDKGISNEVNNSDVPPLPTNGEYFPKTPYDGLSIVDGLLAIGAHNGYNYRCQIAEKNNIKNYTGEPGQNLYMLQLLKEGKLLKP